MIDLVFFFFFVLQLSFSICSIISCLFILSFVVCSCNFYFFALYFRKDAKAVCSKNMTTEEKNAIESNFVDDVRCSGNIRNIENDTEHLIIDFPPHDQLVVDNVTLSEMEQIAVNKMERTASATNEMPGKGASFNPETGNDGHLQRAIVAGLDTSSSQVEMNKNQVPVDEIAQAAR